MQNAFGKFILFVIVLFFSSETAAQSRIRFETPDGFKIAHLSAKAWTPWGLEIVSTYDSVNHEILIPKNFNRIRVSGVGYITLDTILAVEIPVGTHMVFIIEPEKKILDEAVVSVSRSDEKIRDATVSVTSIKPYLIENKIALDAGQVLDQIPGVNVADNQINIRNGNGWSYGAGSRVMVMVDDLPMLSADAQAAQLTFMPLEQVAGVEVVKSAGSVLYGSSALNGVVSLRTIEAGNKPAAMASAFAGVYGNPPRDSLKWSGKTRGAYGSSGLYSIKLKNTGFVVSFNALNNQGYRMNEYENRGRLSLRVKTTSEKVKGLQYGASVSAQSGKSGSFLLWESYGYGYIPLDSGYNYSRSKKLSLDPFIKYRGKKIYQLLQGRMLLLDNQIDNGNPRNDQSNGSSLINGEYRAGSAAVKSRYSFTSGLVYMYSETHSPLFSGKQTAQNVAAYFQTDLRLPRFRAQAGMRIENYRLNDFEQTRPVFRTGANYTLARYTNLRASWGQGYRFPSIAEAFISTSAGQVQVYPNPDLKPETGNNAEIGIKQGFRIGRLYGYADLAAFRTTYNNLMEFTFAQWGDIFSPLFGLGFKSVNTNKASINGFELETAGFGKIGNYDIKFIGGYTYTIPLSIFPDSVFTKDRNNIPLTYAGTRADSNNYLKYRYKHLIRLDFQVRRGRFEPGISLRYNSAMLNMDAAFTGIIGLVSPGIGTAWKELGSALVTDLRLAWYVKAGLRANFQVLNATNTLYFNRPADLRPPRSYQLQLLWHFN